MLAVLFRAEPPWLPCSSSEAAVSVLVRGSACCPCCGTAMAALLPAEKAAAAAAGAAAAPRPSAAAAAAAAATASAAASLACSRPQAYDSRRASTEQPVASISACRKGGLEGKPQRKSSGTEDAIAVPFRPGRQGKSCLAS